MIASGATGKYLSNCLLSELSEAMSSPSPAGIDTHCWFTYYDEYEKAELVKNFSERTALGRSIPLLISGKPYKKIQIPQTDEEEAVKLFNNHSCDPNCGMHGEITFVAIRDIQPGEELTVDYAFIDNEDYSFECHCESEKCRHIITGYDWKITRLQDEYYPYFAQYLKDKIDKIRQQSI